MKFINKKARELAKEIHREEHLIIDKKIEKDHRLEDWYYLMASGIFNKLNEENIKLYNSIVGLSNEFRNLRREMKEISKQQKYLWSELNDIIEVMKNKKED